MRDQTSSADHTATVQTQPTTTYRPGTLDDAYAVFRILEASLADLVQRRGDGKPTSAADPEKLARMWAERRSLFEHLGRTACHYWIAEQDGQPVGYARAIQRGGLRQLTELFIAPGVQSAGIGRALLQRVLPPGDTTQTASAGARTIIVASPDERALALYLRQGVYPYVSAAYWGRTPAAATADTDLAFHPIQNSPQNLERLAMVDQAVLGYRRDEDHAWLLDDRQGVLYARRGRVVGYGYEGHSGGPFALLDPEDFPAVLAHAETAAAAAGQTEFGVEAPLVARTAVDWLLSRGYRMDWMITQIMSEQPFGQFDRYLLTTPPFIL